MSPLAQSGTQNSISNACAGSESADSETRLRRYQPILGIFVLRSSCLARYGISGGIGTGGIGTGGIGTGGIGSGASPTLATITILPFNKSAMYSRLPSSVTAIGELSCACVAGLPRVPDEPGVPVPATVTTVQAGLHRVARRTR